MNDKSVSTVSLNSCHFQETEVKANYTDGSFPRSINLHYPMGLARSMGKP